MSLNVTIPPVGMYRSGNLSDKTAYINSGKPIKGPLKVSDLEPNKKYLGAVETDTVKCAGLEVATLPDSSVVVRYGRVKPNKGVQAIEQTLAIMNGAQIKETRVTSSKGNFVGVIQELGKDGSYSAVRFNNDDIAKGFISKYEVKPLNRKFAQKGLAARLEKLALKIGNDANGFEVASPTSRRIAGWIFDSAQVIKKFI